MPDLPIVLARKWRAIALSCMLLVALAATADAATIRKANNNNTLNKGNSWIVNTAPT